MVIWAMITDVIDDAEVKTECGKMVRFIPCIPLQESWDRHFRPEWWEVFFPPIGYSQATAFDPVVTEGIFKISCIVPIIGLTAVALALIFSISAE